MQANFGMACSRIFIFLDFFLFHPNFKFAFLSYQTNPGKKIVWVLERVNSVGSDRQVLGYAKQ